MSFRAILSAFQLQNAIFGQRLLNAISTKYVIFLEYFSHTIIMRTQLFPNAIKRLNGRQFVAATANLKAYLVQDHRLSSPATQLVAEFLTVICHAIL